MLNQTEFEKLKALRESGDFHHATIRNLDRCYGGLFFYSKEKEGSVIAFRGFELAGSVGKNDPDFDAAIDLCKGTGISVGSYGNG